MSDRVVPELYERFDRELVRGVECIFACGDLPPEYLSFLRDRVDAPLYYVLGNHDIRFLNTEPVGCTYVHGRLVRVGEYRLLGLSGSRWYNGGPFQYHEARMRALLRRLWLRLRLAGGVDIVLTHAPPRHIGDREDRCHKGFVCYRRLIEKYAPAWFIHGHIHAEFSTVAERITLYKHASGSRARQGVRANVPARGLEPDAGKKTTRVVNCCGYVLLEL